MTRTALRLLLLLAALAGGVLAPGTLGRAETFNVIGSLGGSGGPAAAGTLTGTTLASNVVTSSLTAVGALTSGSATTGFVLGGVTMTLGSDGTGDVYYRSAGGVLTRLGIGSTGNVLTVAAGLPSWAAGGGTITSSTATFCAIYSAATTINGFAGCTYTDPGQFAITHSAIGATSSDGLLLTNATAAANNAQQWSPRLHFTGRGWGTTGSASQVVDFIEELQPVQGTVPTANLVWSSQINAGGYTARASLSSGGVFNVTGVGSAAAPTLTVGNLTTGFYSVSTTGLGISIGGVVHLDYGITTPGFLTATSTSFNVSNLLNLPATTGAATGVFQFGGIRYFHVFGGNNLFLGNQSGNFTLSGTGNVGVGASTLVALTSGGNNVAVGATALQACTSCASNAVLGVGGGGSLTTGTQNIIMGGAMATATNDQDDIALGVSALAAANGSFRIVSIGTTSAANITSGSTSVYIGYGTGGGVTTGTNNLVLGPGASGLSAGLSNAIIFTNGTSSSAYQLEYGVTTASTWTTTQAFTFTSATVKLTGITTGTNADFLCLSAAGTIQLQTSACTISTLRVKSDWATYSESAMAVVRRLEVGTFHLDLGMRGRDPNAGSLQIGLNAENIASVLPTAAVYEDDMLTPKSYRQEGVIALYGRALQETDERLSRLQADNDNLKIEFEAYRKAHP